LYTVTPYYHNENKQLTTNTAQTSSENGVEFKHWEQILVNYAVQILKTRRI